jgi:pSer/pThr/pTyr-binding forkhead associated (FHA) protein
MSKDKTGIIFGFKNREVHKKIKLNIQVPPKDKHTEYTIGRDKNNSVFIDDDTVSKSHAIIIYRNNHFYIKDNNSSNGTFLNSKKITSGKTVILSNEDRVKVGVTEIIINIV